jgi:transcriptional regulator with XRE-family HTH domain
VLQSLSHALQEELSQLKDKVDIIERGIEPDLSELGPVATTLDQLGNTLELLDLVRLAGVAREEAVMLRKWETENRLPGDDELYQLANAVLSIEDAAMQLVSRGFTHESDMLASDKRRDNTSTYLREAMIVVADEARAALVLAKRAITAFIESDYDKLHLANLPATLHTIWGGFVMLEDEPAANVLSRVTAGIQSRLMDSREAPTDAVLEALADALTSLEYYIESLGPRDERNHDLLRLAESSLADVDI